MTVPIVKDVGAVLLKQRSFFRRQPGTVPYPANDNADALDFDIWNQMFLQRCFKGFTIHDFKDSPPEMVLDLGCGSGFWVIEAARRWPSSHVIGFDHKHIQPSLRKVKQLEDISDRIQWIHGNLLDGLPFPSEHFDFVRIVGLALAVPEDEWQHVFEEVARIMKPGALFEIIEDNAIFPCEPFIAPRPIPTHLIVDIPNFDSLPSSTFSTRTSTSGITTDWPPTPPDASEQFSVKNRKLSLKSGQTSPRTSHRGPPSRSSTFSHPTLFEEPQVQSDEIHPQDHSRLSAAWDAMLAGRFLAPNVLTVLPFYLASCFEEVKSHPPLQILLPPNSFDRKSDSSRGSSLDSEFKPFELSRYSSQSSDDVPEPTSVPTDSLHLAKAVRTVVSCKEAIWIEYQRLFPTESPLVTSSARPKDALTLSHTSDSSTREAFDRAWTNWESDMTDRISSRQCLAQELKWDDPPGDQPFSTWRDTVLKHERNIPTGQGTTHCRSLRSFLAIKAATGSNLDAPVMV